MKLIDRDAILAEITKIYDRNRSNGFIDVCDELDNILSFLDTLEVKEVVAELEQLEYSCIETVYQCGKKPRWNIGDTLAYYEFSSDIEGESVLGKVAKVDFDKEQCDWFYTLENGSVYDEQSLLEEKTYKKN